MYLSELLFELSSVAPVVGVDEKYSVSYSQEPNSEQQAAVDEIVQDWPLREAQLEQEEQINGSVKAIEQEGYDTGKGYKIDLSAKGAADLTGAVVLAKEAVAGGYEGDHYILDSDGLTQEVSYEELIQIGLEYGTARNALYVLASQKTRAVRSAKTVNEVRSLDTSLEG